MVNTMKKRILSALLAVVMVVALLPTAAYAVTVDSNYAPGTYTGQGTGYTGNDGEGKVTVTVILEENDDGDVVISDISADGSSQTSSFWKKAVALLDQIKEKNGTDGVDAVSSATKSSEGIIEATEKALSKAISGFVGGTGEADDPWQISSEAGLRYLQAQVAEGSTYAGKYICLTDDIELTGEWTPIGSGTSDIFAGNFDGKGHTISGMAITDNTLGYAGLFGYIQNGTVIRDVKLENVSIDIEDAEKNVYAGGLVAFAKVDNKGTASTVIDGCSVSGTVNVSTANKVTVVGGLMGFGDQRAAVVNCSTDVDIIADSGTGRATVGGLVAWTSAKGLFMNCYALGDVEVITECTSYDNVGAMFGQLNGIVYNCYTAGTIVLTSEVAPTPAGAIAGNLSSAYVDSCYYLSDNKNVVGTASGTYNSETVLAKTGDELGEEDFVQLLHNNLSASAIEVMQTNTAAAGVNGCEDFAALTQRVDNRFQDWTLEEGTAVLSGSLWTSGDIDDSIFAEGSGTEEDPYIIETEKQLRDFAVSLNDKIDYTNQFVELGDDIDVSGEDWYPIGGSSYLFNGTFDGVGYTISGMSLGAEDDPYVMDSENFFIGLFGILGPKATVKSVDLEGIAIYTTYVASGYVGGIAGITQGSTAGDDYSGPMIDSCSVSGTISHTGAKGNQFVGGLVGMQYKGVIINSAAQVNASGVVTSGDLAEVGGLVGLNNRGLVANCWSDSTIYGSGNRDDGNEGMAAVSNLIACNAGSLVNCWASGDVTTWEHSTYAGMVTGWVTGIGKSYTCWYDLDSSMTLKAGDEYPQYVKPVEPIGTKVASGVSDEGDAYTGGLVDSLAGYNAADYKGLAEKLNNSFAFFPVDIEIWGLEKDALKEWVYDDDSGLVTFGEGNGQVTYVQPECEKYVAPEQVLQDGCWYGRDNDGTTILKITVEDSTVINIEVLQGSSSGDAYEEALEKAKFKSTYGDFSHYEAADTDRFAGGTGTAEDPYLISNEDQLRYLAYSINEDVDWSGVWFQQTADIELEDGDWMPIGWALYGDVKGAKTLIGAYPFRGNYDGGDHTITGLTIGTQDAPADMATAGLFGLTTGDLYNNDPLDGSEQTVELKNIHLRDVYINVSTRYETYAGGLVGSGQYGLYMDNCSVTGSVTTITSESFSRGGGLAASVLRGSVTNSWADVDVVAVTDTNHVYAGGLFGMDNRVTVINCYSLGNVTGNSTNNNKVHIGGLAGQAGGIHINCYAAGDIVSYKTTTDVGILSGRSAGINIEYNCYYNTEARLAQGDTTVSPAVANGVSVSTSVEVNVEGKTAAELASQDFADLLNSNITDENMVAVLDVVNDAIENPASGLAQLNYYRNNALLSWVLEDGVVTFGTEGGEGPDEPDVPVDPDQPDEPEKPDVPVVPSEPSKPSKPGNGSGSGSGSSKLDDIIDSYVEETEPSISFSDVPEGSWYHDYVMDLVKAGVINGYPDGTFRPNGEVTWGEALKLVMKAVGYGDFEAANGHWAGGYMAKALEDLLISSEVDLNAPITRAEMANLVANALKLAPSDNAYPFEDEAPEAAVALYAAGIITGSLDNGHLLFRADSTITRAEMAAIIWRVYNK